MNFFGGKKHADYSALLKYTGGSGIDGSAHSHFLSGGTLVKRQSLNGHVNKSDLAVVNFTYGMLGEYLWNFYNTPENPLKTILDTFHILIESNRNRIIIVTKMHATTNFLLSLINCRLSGNENQELVVKFARARFF